MANDKFIIPSQTIDETGIIDEILKLENGRYQPSRRLLSQIESPYRNGIYIRVSTPGQAENDKVSLEMQKETLLKLASDNKWEVANIYIEPGESGKFMDNREAFSRMIADAFDGKIDIISSWSNDRLARNSTEMTALRDQLWEHKVQVTSIIEHQEIKPKKELYGKQDVMEKLYSFITDWKSEQDNHMRTERFEMGKRGKANRGQIPSKVPYGYTLYFEYPPCSSGRPKRIQHVDIKPEEATVVKEIYSMYDVDLFGTRKIAETLCQRGVPSPRGCKWGGSTIKYILTNPTYTGCVRYGWRLSKSSKSLDRLAAGHKGMITKGVHPKIIEPPQFTRVNERLKRRGAMGGRAVHSKGLLSGLLKCPRCNGKTYLCSYFNSRTYQVIPVKNRHKYKLVEAYFCSNYSQHGRSGCEKGYIISKKKVEKLVVKLITKMSDNPKVKESYIKEMRMTNKLEMTDKLSLLNKERESISTIKGKLFVMLQHGKIGDSEFDHERTRLDKEEKELNFQIDQLRNKISQFEIIEAQSEKAILALGDFGTAWGQSSIEEKKELMTTLVNKIVIRNEEVFVDFRTVK